MFSHRFHRFSQMVRVWNSVNSVYSVGLPMSPVNLCKSVQSVGGLFSTLLQNRLAEMFSHRFHRFSQMVRVWNSVNSVYSVGLPMSPVNLCKSVQSVGGLFSTLLQNVLAKYVLPQNSRNSQNRLTEDVLPQISQILTDGACLEFCEFCEFCGTFHAPSESVRICAICGRIISVAWVIALFVPSVLLVHLRQVHPLCAPPIGLRR